MWPAWEVPRPDFFFFPGHVQRPAPIGPGKKKKSGRGTSHAGHIWRLGDRIRVRAERIDPIRRRVEFSPLP